MQVSEVKRKAFQVHEKAKNYYGLSEQYGYKFLMEVKVIRDEKLYRELNFKTFEDYTINNFGYTRETISNRIQDAEVWGEKYDEALRHYGKTKARQLVLMHESEREKVVEKGIETDSGIKKVDEATTREIEEYQRKLKQKEQEVEKLKNKEPEVIEKEVTKEVVPHDYDGLKSDVQQLELANKELRNRVSQEQERNEAIEGEYQRLANERKKHQEDSEKYRQLNEEMKKMNNQLTDGQKKLKAQKEVYDLVRKANELIVEVAPLTYLIDTENIVDNEYARKPIEKIISNLRDMADRLDTSINQQIYEGEIINE